MIICFEGVPGTGKTYDAVRKVVDNLKAGRVVYTNIDGFEKPEKREFIRQMHDIDDITMQLNLIYLGKEKMQYFWRYVKQGSIIVIDEVHKLFSNRNWASNENKEMSEWASTHRHYGFDVVLLTQAVEKIDSHVRSLIEWTYRYRKVNFFGSFVKNRYIVYAFTGDDTSGKPISSKTHTYDPVIFHCYDSFVSQDIKELKVMTHTNILRHPIFYAVPVLIIIFIIVFSKSSFIHGSIIPGSKNVGVKKSVVDSPGAVPVLGVRNKPIIVEYDNLLKKPSPVLVDVPVEPDKKKIGSVIVFNSEGDILQSRDFFDSSATSTKLGSPAFNPINVQKERGLGVKPSPAPSGSFHNKPSQKNPLPFSQEGKQFYRASNNKL